jgi:hypothetical protein
MTPDVVLAIAAAAGFPMAEVPVTGRRSLVPIEASAAGWARFLAYFGADEVTLSSAVQEVVAWELHVRGQLLDVEAFHA